MLMYPPACRLQLSSGRSAARDTSCCVCGLHHAAEMDWSSPSDSGHLGMSAAQDAGLPTVTCSHCRSHGQRTQSLRAIQGQHTQQGYVALCLPGQPVAGTHLCQQLFESQSCQALCLQREQTQQGSTGLPGRHTASRML